MDKNYWKFVIFLLKIHDFFIFHAPTRVGFCHLARTPKSVFFQIVLKPSIQILQKSHILLSQAFCFSFTTERIQEDLFKYVKSSPSLFWGILAIYYIPLYHVSKFVNCKVSLNLGLALSMLNYSISNFRSLLGTEIPYL